MEVEREVRQRTQVDWEKRELLPSAMPISDLRDPRRRGISVRWIREGYARRFVELGRIEAVAVASVRDIEAIGRMEGEARFKVIGDPLPDDPDHALIRIEPEGEYGKGEVRMMRNQLLKSFRIEEAGRTGDPA